MSLTEVVFKIKSDADALCRATQAAPDLRAVVSHLGWRGSDLAHEALLTLSGPEARVQEVLQAIAPLHERFDLVRQTKDQTVVRTRATLEHFLKSANPLALALEFFGQDAVYEPALVRDGYLHIRVIATQRVDIAELLAAYEKGVAAGRWNDFKLLRIEDFNPETQIQGAFTESLTPKQLEVIKTALALGFYNTPRDVTLDDLSNIFGISKAAVHNRLQAAERKVITKFFS